MTVLYNCVRTFMNEYKCIVNEDYFSTVVSTACLTMAYVSNSCICWPFTYHNAFTKPKSFDFVSIRVWSCIPCLLEYGPAFLSHFPVPFIPQLACYDITVIIMAVRSQLPCMEIFFPIQLYTKFLYLPYGGVPASRTCHIHIMWSCMALYLQ